MGKTAAENTLSTAAFPSPCLAAASVVTATVRSLVRISVFSFLPRGVLGEKDWKQVKIHRSFLADKTSLPTCHKSAGAIAATRLMTFEVVCP